MKAKLRERWLHASDDSESHTSSWQLASRVPYDSIGSRAMKMRFNALPEIVRGLHSRLVSPFQVLSQIIPRSVIPERCEETIVTWNSEDIAGHITMYVWLIQWAPFPCCWVVKTAVCHSNDDDPSELPLINPLSHAGATARRRWQIISDFPRFPPPRQKVLECDSLGVSRRGWFVMRRRILGKPFIASRNDYFRKRRRFTRFYARFSSISSANSRFRKESTARRSRMLSNPHFDDFPQPRQSFSCQIEARRLLLDMESRNRSNETCLSAASFVILGVRSDSTFATSAHSMPATAHTAETLIDRLSKRTCKMWKNVELW